MIDEKCHECDQQFTEDEWENRHTDENGEDVHADCCHECDSECEDE